MLISHPLITRQLFVVLACLSILAGACKKDSSSSSQAPGVLSFSYNGDISGSFSATGNYPSPLPSNGDIFYEWTRAEHIDRFINPTTKEAWTNITANFPTSQTMPESNSINFKVQNKGTGTYPLVNGWTDTQLHLKGELFAFTAGNAIVTSTSNGRIKGSFEGTAKSFGSPGKTIQILNGQFDLNFQ